MNHPWRYALAAAFAVALSGTAQASESAFLKKFHGSFAGSGEVRLKADSQPHQISCNVAGTVTKNTVNIGGKCSAGIMSRAISASLKAAPNGTYSGTYHGVNGKSVLSGRRKGNTIVLAVRGPEAATMLISNNGGAIHLSVTADKTQMTQVSLSRSGGAQLASIAD